MYFQLGAISPNMMPICVWGGWGCIIGRMSKYDHPAKLIWPFHHIRSSASLTVSQQVSQKTQFYNLHLQMVKATSAEPLWSQRASVFLSTFQIKRIHDLNALICKPLLVWKHLISGHDFRPFYRKVTFIFMHSSQSSHYRHGLWLICSGWQGYKRLGSSATGGWGNVRLPSHL